jgi:hypothetical protein
MRAEVFWLLWMAAGVLAGCIIGYSCILIASVVAIWGGG